MPVIRIVMPNGTTKPFREGTPKSVIARAKRDMIASMNEMDEDHRAYRVGRNVIVTGRAGGVLPQTTQKSASPPAQPRYTDITPQQRQEVRDGYRDLMDDLSVVAKVGSAATGKRTPYAVPFELADTVLGAEASQAFVSDKATELLNWTRANNIKPPPPDWLYRVILSNEGADNFNKARSQKPVNDIIGNNALLRNGGLR